MSTNNFRWWTPEEIAGINRVTAPTDSNFSKLRAMAFQAVMAAHREIHLESVAHSSAAHSAVRHRRAKEQFPPNLHACSHRADVARDFLIELEDAIKRRGPVRKS